MQHTYVYDAENRLTGVPDQGVVYTYDVDGQRMAQYTSGTQTKSFLRDKDQNAELIFDSAGNVNTLDVFAAGRHLLEWNQGYWVYPVADILGTTREVVSDPYGWLVTRCLNLPFGDGQTCDGVDQNPHHFTGKERDAESGNDYFGARYYSSTMGRFLSPDDPFADRDLGDPQSLNLYSYVRNNPLSSTDDDGRSVNVCTNDSYGNQQCTLLSNDQYAAASQGNGSLNVPSLNSVGTNGSGNITDANGNTVGTATYSADNSGIDPFVNGNGAGYNQLAGASRVVNAAGSLEMNIMAPYAGALAGCMSGGSAGSCGANLALSLLPEVSELKAGATLLREAAAAGKGAEILSKGGGAAQAVKEFEAIPAVSEQINGATRVKTLSDGSKAVLYESTGGSGRTTISIQNAAGHTETKIRY